MAAGQRLRHAEPVMGTVFSFDVPAAAGPVLPAGFGGDQVQVLGLARTVLANTGGGNAALLATMIQTVNGLRSLLGLVRPH